jgi:UPF0755 protein
VRQGDRESTTDSDPHGLVFGSSEDDTMDGSYDGSFFGDADDDGTPRRVQRVSRSERRAQAGHTSRRRRNRRVLVIMALVLVAVVAAATWLVVLPLYRYLNPADYSGQGTGSVIVEVQANDGAQDIADTLKKQGVVASVRAFTDAAKDDKRSQNIQPGAYELRKHMSAKNALALLLDPTSRVNSDVVVTEGATELDVLNRLTAKPCEKGTPGNRLCGPGMSKAAVQRAMKDVKALGLPTDYLSGGKTPQSVEGFLYPATYYFPAKTTPVEALGQMITNFTDQARSTNFTAAAKANKITPYQQLIIASIAQSEAKYPDDFAKVARVILNRIAAGRHLQVDATSSYACKISGTPADKCIYEHVPGPYNTYANAGLPPTPIGNPGAEAMGAAAHPATGNWLYYVNGDAAGHLFFTNSEAAFVKAAARCKANHWGCG